MSTFPVLPTTQFFFKIIFYRWGLYISLLCCREKELITVQRQITLGGDVMPGNYFMCTEQNQSLALCKLGLCPHTPSKHRWTGCALRPRCGKTVKLCRHLLFSVLCCGKVATCPLLQPHCNDASVWCPLAFHQLDLLQLVNLLSNILLQFLILHTVFWGFKWL